MNGKWLAFSPTDKFRTSMFGFIECFRSVLLELVLENFAHVFLKCIVDWTLSHAVFKKGGVLGKDGGCFTQIPIHVPKPKQENLLRKSHSKRLRCLT